MRRWTYNHVPYILINFLCALVNFFCAPVDFLGFLVNFLRGLADFLCGLVDLLRASINRPSSFMDALLYRCLSETLDRPLGKVRDTHLIVCDGTSQILDEPVQGICMVHVL